MTNLFSNAYNKLNLEQKQAVDALTGPVMVVAGPGTGKTQILALRIVNILEKDDSIKPQNILALTYTDSGVNAMRKRLIDFIGNAAYKVNIFSFHSFCNQIINENTEEFLFHKDLELINELEKAKIIKNIIDSADYIKLLKPFGDNYHYLRTILSRIQKIKQENVSVEQFVNYVNQQKIAFDNIPEIEKVHQKGRFKGNIKSDIGKQEKEIKKYIEFSLIYKNYQERLRESGKYDFEDMIFFVFNKMKKDKSFLQKYQEKFSYILVDEYQDTNNSQNAIVEQLTLGQENPNVFVVGDDDQAIYRFQGASMENILYFHKKYPHLKIIPLKQNYRSTQTIIDAAETLINQNQNKITKIIPGIEKKFVAKTGNVENKIKVAALSTEESEYFYIVEKIKELSAQGMAYKDMAVIYRNNKDALPLTELLKKINIPFSLSMDENVLDNFYVKKFINALKLINKPKDNVAFIDYLFSEFFSVPKEDLIALSQHVYSNKGSIYEILKTKEMPEGLSLSNKEIFFQIIDVINDLIIAQQNLPFQEYVVKALHAFKISEKILCSKENLIALTMMNSFVSWVREQSEKNPQYNLSKMIEDISFMKDINIKIPGQELYGSSEGANLLTAHKAKGLEFPVVFIIKSIDVNWEEKRSAEKLKLPQDLFYLSDVREPDEKEEIRRLYYVALTRAKEQVFISYHIRKNDGKELLPSMFIKELKDDTKEFENVEGYEKKVIERITLNLSQDKGAQAEEVSLNYLKKLAGQYVLNPTALNNYLKCPAFFKFNNLYRIPSESNKHAALGSSIHKTLEYVFRIAEKGAMPDIKKWEEFFEKNILTYPLVELDLKQCLTQGKEYLRGYYNNYKASFHTRCLLEYDFSHRHVHFEEIPITGKLDKVEIHSDNTVTIVDYKTGKAKSRRDILGLNASSDGGYFRQLVFYKLLVDSDARFPYKIKDTMLDFIKPKDNGEYSREYFEIDDESLSALKALIKEVHSKILNLDFPKTENKKECEECVYRGYC